MSTKTPATAKANGKCKPKNDDVPEKLPIAHSSTSKSHHHHTNGANSNSKAKLSDEEQEVKVSEEAEVVRAANGIDGSKNKKTKEEVKEDSLLYLIPMSRVTRIIKSEDPNVRITQEAVYIINKASEKFLQVFTTEAHANAFLDRKKHIDYQHLSSVISKRRRFDFLSDIVPEKVKAEDALVEAQAIED